MAGVADALGLRQVVDDGPAGDEEGGAQAQPVEQSQDTIHADARTEPTLFQIPEAALGLLGLAEQETGFGIEVERQDGCRLLVIGPRIAHETSPCMTRSAGGASTVGGNATVRTPSACAACRT